MSSFVKQIDLSVKKSKYELKMMHMWLEEYLVI